ncbi:MAG TPA: malto-oligosyltrehalose synthase, partial [Thermodesulfobacteriota bacterium]|nr:malto-oligosyltrehalose synthase [Thermodesulfobacteriota bacterium]
TDEINYRRFFDVNELAAIKVESSPVFNEIHNLIFRLIRDQAVTGLRVDHPDGLYNPVEYFFRLQKNCFIQYCRQMTAEPTREEAGEAFLDEEDIRQLQTLYDEDLMHNPHSPLRAPFYIVGEKILMNDEKLPDEWPIFGTVGYSFLNSVNGIFVNSENARSFENLYSRFISRALSYDDLVYEKKKLIMQVAMSAEITFLTHFLNHLSEKNRHTRDFTFNSLRMVIREVISFFPVYRTYVNDCGVIERDRRYIEQAVSRAIRKNPAISASIFNFLKSILLLEYPEDLSQSDKRSWLDFVMKLQQVTGPVMAKGVEDTVYYIYNRLISNNEVGGDPEKFGLPLEAFHQENIERSRMWPFSLLASSTHDTKRSEDIRARINVLSESPKEWRRSLTRWARINEKKKTLINGTPAPDANEEYFLYQTLLGSWPLESEDEQRAGEYEARIKETMLKALREAKIHSSWINPETSYEEAVVQFIERLLTPSPTNAFLHNFLPYQSKIAFFGMLNSLSQTLLKMTAPGIPDFYQGTELWDFSLADPDNRRPVDFKIRQDRLRGVMEEIRKGKDPARLGPEFLTSWRDGRIKLYLIFQALDFRRRHEQVFAEGDYLPLYGSGRLKNHLCAFARQKNGKTVITITPRFLSQLLESPETLPLNTVWEDSRLLIPPEISAETFKNILTGETLTVSAWEGARVIFVREALAHFPLALLDSILEPTLKKGSQEQIPLWRD